MIEALIAYLLADSGLTALVSTRIGYVVNDQATADPRVTITPVSRVPAYADDGEAGLTESRVQIDSYSTVDTNALAISRAVFARLSAVSATLSGVDFQTVHLVSEDVGFEKYDDGSELFRVRQDYIIWHNA